MTISLAELVGMHTGDGTLYKTGYSLVWELRGGLKEKEYYLNHVGPLLEKIFKRKFKVKIRSGGKNGCFGIQTGDKKLIKTLMKCGFKSGRKTHTISVLPLIFSGSKKIKYAFLRGLFDTDGCLRFDKNHTEIHSYPKIEFSFASKNLTETLSQLLTMVSIKHHTWIRKGRYVAYSLCIPGNKRITDWFSKIGSNNPKHLKKWGNHLQKVADVAQPGTARTS